MNCGIGKLPAIVAVAFLIASPIDADYS